MSCKVESLCKGYKILYVAVAELILFRNLTFYILDKKSKSIKRIGSIEANMLIRLLSRLRLINRLLRLEPQNITMVSPQYYLCQMKGETILLDVMHSTLRVLQSKQPGWSTPLNTCKDDRGNIYWGNYGNNPLYNSVAIYQLKNIKDINIVYTFPSGSVRHIHNIIYDSSINRFYILTGDNETVSGIYVSDDRWTTVLPYKVGKQRYRSVVGFPYRGGLLYATDSIVETNYVFMIDEFGNECEVCAINGSCIYGTELKDVYVFATTVEPKEGRGFFNLFTNKKASGILSDEIQIVVVKKDNLEVKIIASWKKDCLPMKLFQYGTATFPKGQEMSEDLICYPIACRKVDGMNMKIRINENK